MVAASLMLVACQPSKTPEERAAEAWERRSITDPATGCVYYFTTGGSQAAPAITPRLDSHGRPMGCRDIPR